MATSLEELKALVLALHEIVEKNNDKIDMLCKKMDVEIINECKKMGSHIDFVEGVYENMKHPLNYICDAINGGSNNSKSICNDDM